jgi:hypothetical protein
MAPPDRAQSYAEVSEAVCRRFESITNEPFQLSIFEPQAVGKMAVGLEVQRLTGAPLLHAHRVLRVRIGAVFPAGARVPRRSHPRGRGVPPVRRPQGDGDHRGNGRHLSIENSALSPAEAAELIVGEFRLPRLGERP